MEWERFTWWVNSLMTIKLCRADTTRHFRRASNLLWTCSRRDTFKCRVLTLKPYTIRIVLNVHTGHNVFFAFWCSSFRIHGIDTDYHHWLRRKLVWAYFVISVGLGVGLTFGCRLGFIMLGLGLKLGVRLVQELNFRAIVAGKSFLKPIAMFIRKYIYLRVRKRSVKKYRMDSEFGI